MSQDMDSDGEPHSISQDIEISPFESRSSTPFGSPPTPTSPSLDLPSLDNLPTSSENIDDHTSKDVAMERGTSGRVFSKIWTHYDKVEVDGKRKAKCKYCEKLLLGDPKQGTSHLTKHYERCPRRKMTDIRQQVLKANFNKDKFDVSPFNFDQEVSRKELARMIIMHEYPLKMIEHHGFKNFVKSLNPCFKIVTRNTLKNDCMKIYEQLKEATMSLFEKNESRVAVTTDMWTSSHQKKGFMAITAHYIDNNWRLQSRIIRFVYVPSPHTSEALGDALVECFLDWNIDRKLSTITVDNCSTNDAMVELLLEKLPLDSLLLGGKLVHMRCCAHILNLIVKDGLEVIGEAIEKVRDSVSYWSGTPKRWEKFEETARQLRIPLGKKLILDCKTRWNSTYLMLQTALDYKDVFFRLKHRDPKYKHLPSEFEWSLTEEICSRLKLFYTATELFSGTKYPTANLYFPKICEIKVVLKQWLSCGIEVVETMSSSMIAKFDKYWSVAHGIMGVAVVLDPRYKLVLLEYYFPKIYLHESEYEVEKILILCRELLKQYEDNEKKKGDGDVSSLMMETSATIDNSLSEFDLYASRKKRKPLRSELDLYLDEDVLPRTVDFDVLSWWKANRGKYPILSQIAKDILAIPVSTVASESAFSTSGRLVSPHRSRLHHKTVEALMCAQNWILSEKDHSDGAYMSVFYDSDDEKSELEV